VRAAAAVVLILDVDAARRERRAAAVRGEGANVLTCGDLDRARAILDVVKPAIAVVPSVVSGSLVDPVATIRSAVDGGDIAVIVAGGDGVDADRYRTLIDAHDVVACLDPPAPEDAVRVAVATLLGRPPPPAARKGPRDVQLQTLRGSLRFSQSSGERLAALERVDALVAAEPTLADAWVTRGHLLVDLGRAGEALRSFEVAATLDPTSGDAWIAWATQLDRAGLARRALRTWQHAAAIVTDDAARRRIEARLRR
jgi:predicted Zn-dependent protease